MSKETEETTQKIIDANVVKFSDLGLSKAVMKAVEETGYEAPSAIQAESIPPLLEGRDLLGQAQTGTGKTAAFALPILSQIDLKKLKPQILVLAPTRELAIQVAEAMQTYARHLKGFHVLPVYGGAPMSHQLRMLKRGVHAVVGTPGRVMDHLGRGTLQLGDVAHLVLDEADEMLRMGFIDEVEEILAYTPESKQVALFSATMPREIQNVTKRYLKDPVHIKIKNKTTTVNTITQRYWPVRGLHKMDALTRMLEVEDFDAMIIFVRTKSATVDVAEKLEARGFNSSPLNGDMNQRMRESAIEKLKNGGLDIIVATDVAARGLDVPRISHVINYDIPTDTESYVHRIGRTGRAGRTGNAILFVSPRERRLLYAIERATNQKIEQMQLPTKEDVTDRRITQFKEKINKVIASEDLGFFEELMDTFEAESTSEMSEIAAALAHMAQQGRPLQVEERGEQHRQPHDNRSANQARWESERDNFSPSNRGNDRGRGRDRSDRGDRNRGRDQGRDRKRPERSFSGSADNMSNYRISVGRTHGVQPKNIVGAMTNEAGIDFKSVGHIKLHDNYSTVELPANLPSDIFESMKNIWVCGQKLDISRDSGGGDNSDSGDRDQSGGYERKPRKQNANKGGGSKSAGNKNAGSRKPRRSGKLSVKAGDKPPSRARKPLEKDGNKVVYKNPNPGNGGKQRSYSSKLDAEPKSDVDPFNS